MSDFFWDYELWVRNGSPIEYVAMSARATDPDAFTEHGCEHAIDRWADDGGRA